MSLCSIIVPVYNEGENIRHFYKELQEYLPADLELLWVDDGSTDSTLLEIENITREDKRVKCISLSRNFGHQHAILAGLHYAKGELFITMDGDLQHPPSMIPILIDRIRDGYDIVNTKRISTEKVSFFKKISSAIYYPLLNSLSDTTIKKNSCDFRAFTKKVHSAILLFEERDPFLRGIFSWVGFRNTMVEFTATARSFGKTKYSFTKMMKLGTSGVISFSTKPLKIAFIAGLLITFLSFLFLGYAIYAHLKGYTLPGWTSVIGAVVFLGGIQLSFMGLIGVYIGRLLTETRKRPSFIIDRKINI